MKIILKKCTILFLMLIICSTMVLYVSAAGDSNPGGSYILGDVDADGKVIIKDATRIQKIVAKILSSNERSNLAGDVDFDGRLTVKDATLIQKYLAKIIKNSPIGTLMNMPKPVYTLAYNANGGTGNMIKQSLVYDQPDSLQANSFARTGYKFSGWATSANGPVVYADKQDVLNLTNVNGAVINLYAVWKPNTYTIIYNANGGSGANYNQVFTYDQGQNLTANKFARTGYEFSGWAASSNGSTVYTDKQNVKNITAKDTDKINLYAVWSPNKYTVSYNANGGSGTMPDQSFIYGQTYNLPANKFTLTGYSFAGWATSANGAAAYKNKQSVSNLTAKSAITLYAVWSPNKYTIVFNANGGLGTMNDQGFIYDKSQALSGNEFIYTNHAFAGWATSPTGKAVYRDKQSVSNLTNENGGVINLYATWKPMYIVAFNANGGTGTMPNQIFVIGEIQALSENQFTRAGYTFKGWATSAGGSVVYADKKNVGDLTSVSGATYTLYAVWEISNYTIIFNANGGSGYMAEQGFTYNETQALRANTFTRTGYTFMGWALSANGAVEYKDKQNAANRTDPNGSKITLYAIWKANTYTVIFNGNGSTSGTMANQVFTYDQAQNLRANAFKRTGYTFQGWSTSSGNNSVVYTAGQSVKNLKYNNGDVLNLYAVWK